MNEQQINERFLRISSKLPFPQDIELGSDIVMTLGGQTFVLNNVKQETLDKQNGTVDKIFILKYAGE